MAANSKHRFPEGCRKPVLGVWGGGWRTCNTEVQYLPKVMNTSLLRRGLQGAQELCESRGGRPGVSVTDKPTVSVDVKGHFNQPTWTEFTPIYPLRLLDN